MYASISSHSRAVLIVNILAAVFALLGAIVVLAGGEVIKANDSTPAEASVAFEDVNSGWIIIVGIIQIICYSIGAYGAVQFNASFVWVALVMHLVALLGSFITFNIIGIIMIAFFIYPHVFFLREMRAGIMTPDNYANEVHSCCCV